MNNEQEPEMILGPVPEKKPWDWRPTDWPQIRDEVARMPYIWGTAKKALPEKEQIVENAASRILEAYIKEHEQKAGSIPNKLPTASINDVHGIISDALGGNKSGT